MEPCGINSLKFSQQNIVIVCDNTAAPCTEAGE